MSGLLPRGRRMGVPSAPRLSVPWDAASRFVMPRRTASILTWPVMACAAAGSGTVIAADPESPALRPAFVVRFAQDKYIVGVNDFVLEVSLIVEPPPPAGLVSYGVRMNFDPGVFRTDPGLMRVPGALDFNGIAGAGALLDAGLGYATAKGTVDLLGASLRPYDSALIAVVGLVPTRREVGLTGTLSLGLYPAFEPGEAVFVGGDGTVLDADLGFGTATFTLIPEPSGLPLMGLGVGMLWSGLWWQRRCRETRKGGVA